MTHAELCLKTAKRFVDKMALYEYKAQICAEEPDVLVYGFTHTVLYEIKMSRSDYLADRKKECRKKYETNIGFVLKNAKTAPEVKRAYFRITQWHPELFLKQSPHLGNYRYFVCEHGLINPDELPEGWGLYWFKGGKFYEKKGSAKFRSNLKVENNLAVHAMRRFASGDKTGILVNTY